MSGFDEAAILGNQFKTNGMAELNNRVLGEEEAKMGLLVGYVTGLNVVMVGEPGGGKTTLSAEAHRLIEGIHDDNVARVPHHSDLTPQQLIGGSITTTKTITEKGGNDDGSDYVGSEDLTSTIKPIIHADTQVIWLDELNRVNPFAVNGVLGALENGSVTTDAGEVKLKGLELAISTMNPTETRQATFPVAAATASRHAIGAVMGNDRDDTASRGDKIDMLLDGWEPGKIEAVVSVDQLRQLRSAAKDIALPTSLKKTARELILSTVDALGDNRMQEADPRITKHVAQIARGLAILNAEPAIREENLRDAVRYVVTARLGIMGVGAGAGHNLHSRIGAVVDNINGRV